MLNYRRGLTRLYLVLWVGWVGYFFFVIPRHMRMEDLELAAHFEEEARREPSADLRAHFLEAADRHREYARNLSLLKVVSEMRSEPASSFMILVGAPGMIYGALYAGGAVLVWILRGFRPYTESSR